jgi:hypothetical protein
MEFFKKKGRLNIGSLEVIHFATFGVQSLNNK